MLFAVSSVEIVCAQNTDKTLVCGDIKDIATHRRIEGATIEVLRMDSTLIAKSVTRPENNLPNIDGVPMNGWVMIKERIRDERVLLKVSHPEYATEYSEFKLIGSRKWIFNFGSILLFRDNFQLDEVTVSATKVRMVMGKDTITYNASEFQLAQGSMLDIDFGSYPFVTSSNTVCAGACTGLGVAPNRIGNVYGITKAYCTRVGAGPFPTELFDEDGKEMRDRGHEYGAVTGRERRCGWIDLVALKYTIMINGVTHLILMKSDVLDTFPTIKACIAYKKDGETLTHLPYDIEGVEPVYTEIKGWMTDLTKLKSEEELPQAFKDYIAFLEKELGVPVKYLSIGPDRDQTITRSI